LVVISFILLLVWASTTIGPTIGNQILNLAQQINIETANNIAGKIETQVLLVAPFIGGGQIKQVFTQFIDRLLDIGDLQSALSDIVGSFADVLTAALIRRLATFLFLKDGSKLRRQSLKIVPDKYVETALTIHNQIEARLLMYFKGVFIQ